MAQGLLDRLYPPESLQCGPHASREGHAWNFILLSLAVLKINFVTHGVIKVWECGKIFWIYNICTFTVIGRYPRSNWAIGMARWHALLPQAHLLAKGMLSLLLQGNRNAVEVHCWLALRSSVRRRRLISCPALIFTPSMQTGLTPTFPSGGISLNFPTCHLCLPMICTMPGSAANRFRIFIASGEAGLSPGCCHDSKLWKVYGPVTSKNKHLHKPHRNVAKLWPTAQN